MPDHQREREVPKPQSKKHDVTDIVEIYLGSVMRDRTNMRIMESALDAYVKSLSPEEKQEQRPIIHKQLTDGRLALESLLQRFLSS